VAAARLEGSREKHSFADTRVPKYNLGMRDAFAIGIMFLSTLLSLPAQDQESSAQQMPTGPLLKRVSAPSEWTVITQAAAPQPGVGNAGSGATGTPLNPANPAKPAKPKVITVIKDGKLIYEKTVNEHGDVIEAWHTSAAMATRVNARDWTALPGVGSDFYHTDYSNSDFAGFDWISLNNFAGRGSVLGKKCLIFKSKVIIMDAEALRVARQKALNELVALHPDDYSISFKDVNDDQFKVAVEADIDEQTRLPVKLTYQTAEGTTTRTYTFQAPASSLDLPPEAQQALNKYEKYLKGMSARIAPI